jgi:HK97 family phage portal protein
VTVLRALVRELRDAGQGSGWGSDTVALPNTASGQRVTVETGSRLAVAYSCIRYLADTVGALPRQAFRESGHTRSPVRNPAWAERANLDLSTQDFLAQCLWALNTHGNAYALLTFGPNGLVSELLPVHPSLVSVERGPDGRPVYTVDGVERPRDQVLHIPGLVLPGQLVGLSPIDYCRATFGLGQAVEEYGGSFFANGAAPGGVITYPAEKDPSEESLARMARSWRRSHGGSAKAHLPGVLTGGATWTPVTIPNDQAQFLETKKLNRSEIAGIFRVLPHRVADLEHATYSNIETQGEEEVRVSFLPWLVKLEHHLSGPRFLPRGQFFRLNVEGLLRGDTASRYRSYAIGRQWGFLSVDEIRALENRPPLPDGKGQEYLVPQNMAAAGLEASDPITGGRQNGGSGAEG